MSFFWWHIVLLNKDNEQLVPVCYLYATQDFADFYHILPKSPFFTKSGEFSISSSSCRHYFISLLPICEQLPFHLYAFQDEGTQTVQGVKVCCGFVWCCDVDNFISRSFSSTTLDFLMFFFWLLSTQQMLSCGRICKSKISLLSGCGCKMSFYMWSSVCFSCAHHFPFTYFEFICHFIAHSVSFLQSCLLALVFTIPNCLLALAVFTISLFVSEPMFTGHAKISFHLAAMAVSLDVVVISWMLTRTTEAHWQSFCTLCVCGRNYWCLC